MKIVIETDDDVVFQIEVPGVSATEVDNDVDNDEVTVTVEAL